MAAKTKSNTTLRLVSSKSVFLEALHRSNISTDMDLAHMIDLGESNKIYSLIDYTNKYCCMVVHNDTTLIFMRTPGRDGDSKHKIRLLSVTAFRNYLMNVSCENGKFSTVWLSSPERRSYSDAGIYPPGGPPCPSDTFNLCDGFTVKPKEGPQLLSLLDWHILHICCNGDVDSYEYFMNFMSMAIMCPSKSLDKCLVMLGKKGCGKSVMMDPFLAIVGNMGVRVESSSMLSDKFNGWAYGKTLAVMDEAKGQFTNPKVQSTLKALITSKTINLRQMKMDYISVPNYTSWVLIDDDISTNFLQITSDTRRMSVLKCSDQMIGNTRYFSRLGELLTKISVQEALLYRLTDTSKAIVDGHISFDPRIVPVRMNHNLINMKLSNCSIVVRYIYELCFAALCHYEHRWEGIGEVALMAFPIDDTPGSIASSTIYSGIISLPINHDCVSKVVIGKNMRKLFPMTNSKRSRGFDDSDDAWESVYDLPSISTAKDILERATGVTFREYHNRPVSEPCLSLLVIPIWPTTKQMSLLLRCTLLLRTLSNVNEKRVDKQQRPLFDVVENACYEAYQSSYLEAEQRLDTYKKHSWAFSGTADDFMEMMHPTLKPMRGRNRRRYALIPFEDRNVDMEHSNEYGSYTLRMLVYESNEREDYEYVYIGKKPAFALCLSLGCDGHCSTEDDTDEYWYEHKITVHPHYKYELRSKDLYDVGDLRNSPTGGRLAYLFYTSPYTPHYFLA